MTPANNISLITDYLNTYLLPEECVGCAFTGAKIIGLGDKQSDDDLVVFIYNRDKAYLSNVLSFYSSAEDKYIEILVEDLYNLSIMSLEEFSGYCS
jgi:hypothetical protein